MLVIANDSNSSLRLSTENDFSASLLRSNTDIRRDLKEEGFEKRKEKKTTKNLRIR